MLLELKVSNFAIIENLHIQFQKGLNILSGETGAGKSVLLKSLSLLMGQKGSIESIRTGCAQASIEGSFDISKRTDIQKKLADLGIEVEEDLLIVKRVLCEDKSRVYLNGSLCTLHTLRDIVAPLIEVAGASAPLIEMTGQFENRHLLSKAYHLDLLDTSVGQWNQRTVFQDRFQEWKKLLAEIQQLEQNSQNKSQRLDFLLFQRDEIAKLDLNPGEDLELEAEVKRLKSSSRLENFVETAEVALSADNDSATHRLHSVIKKAQELSALDPQLNQKIQNLETARTLIEDTLFDLRKYLKTDGDPQRLESLEQRLSDLRKIQKKYGPSVDDILKALVQIENEIQTLQNSEEKIEQLRQAAGKIKNELEIMAKALHKKRVAGAATLAEAVNKELMDLNMKGVTFHVDVHEALELTSSGMTEAEFMSQSAPNDPPRPLAKFASGGELSRILLSLKRVVGSSHQPRTYLFDEVDTGVSGPTAEKVGRKLKAIAKNQQVICVTHLPQVAACGDAHFFIQKSPKKGAVMMEVSELHQSDRTQEIARLISGEKITKTSLAHAKELLSISSPI